MIVKSRLSTIHPVRWENAADSRGKPFAQITLQGWKQTDE